MPTIYDNIDADLLGGLKDSLTAAHAQRADICVGYFNLRGWRCVADEIDALPGGHGAPACRLIVGMTLDAAHAVRAHYNDADDAMTQRQFVHRRRCRHRHSPGGVYSIARPRRAFQAQASDRACHNETGDTTTS